MDADRESFRGKALVIAIGVFLISTFFVFVEFMYFVDSREATANITKGYKVQQRGRFGQSTGERLAFDYEFTDADGNARTGRDEVATDWPIPQDLKVKVRYRPGPDGNSRFAGHVRWTPVIIFFVCLAIVGVFGYRLWNEANQAYATPKRKK